jgi:hypothetical protein
VNPPLDESYFRWLYSQVCDVEEIRPSRTYWGLLRQLYVTEFVWIIPNDDNRADDGKDLRAFFAKEMGLYDYAGIIDPVWESLGCSMLELLIGLSRRLSFQAEGEPRVWFWRLIKNANLLLDCDLRKFPRAEISEKLDRIIWRKYEYNGHGGLFPLRDSYADQREVELWYQMQAYVIQNC